MSPHWKPTRRDFLQFLAVAAGGLVIGVPLADARNRSMAPLALHPLVRVPPDGPIII